ncbi:hypothetical protein ACH475_35030 [Streptomyces globisporus]|uniref:hypothetical protein n=1 Tax=Streptomyces globisporus TaxID=1908 RepID=UPI002F90DA8B|nr:hypothetical protein OG215_42030 [Streptomyces globisporus]
MDFPGYSPMRGDKVQFTAGLLSVSVTGAITSVGILRDGAASMELALPDVDPQQRRDLEQACRDRQYQYELFDGDRRLYLSPWLTLHEVRRSETDGALVITGAPRSAS